MIFGVLLRSYGVLVRGRNWNFACDVYIYMYFMLLLHSSDLYAEFVCAHNV